MLYKQHSICVPCQAIEGSDGLLLWQPRCPLVGHRIQVQEQLAHDRNQGDFPRLASWLQVLMEVLKDACLPHHGQGRHVQCVVQA